MTRSARRGPWLPEEDRALLQLVCAKGPNNWVRISQQIQQRSPKQCRERYHQNLKPSLKHDPISVQEGELIEQMVREMGKRWAEIARRLGNRSDNAVKNWWNGSMNRRKRVPLPSQTAYKDSRDHYGFVPQQPLPPTAEHKPWKKHIPASLHIPDNTTHSHSPSDHHHRPLPTPGLDRSSQIPQSPAEQKELPPLRYISDERNQSGFDRPGISPALSDESRYIPSLTSDNQSTYSISPKTVPSPRSFMYADRGGWERYDALRHQQEQMKTQVSHTTSDQVGLDRVLHHHHHQQQHHHQRLHDGSSGDRPLTHASSLHSLLSKSTPIRDTRMHVSNLLG